MLNISLPSYLLVPEADHQGTLYSVITHAESSHIPENLRQTFKTEGEAIHIENGRKTIFITPQRASKVTINSNVFVKASEGSSKQKDYLGNLTDLLSSAYVFHRKQKKHIAPVVSLIDSSPLAKSLINLTQARVRARDWGNGRGDIEGTPKYFREICQSFAKEHGLDITIISGDDLLKQGFRLMHAVGRASVNKPIFINIAYKGNPNSDEWVSYVGKGLVFDTGGLNIKPFASMLTMYLDKCGAINILSAFQAIVKEKIPINLLCTLGFVQNSINQNAYRPSDIIASRKGLTVQIGHTDAEGRLVLADCMNWVQEKFKVHTLIELSTLTGAIISALGSERSGLWTNDKDLFKTLRDVGQTVHELSWLMPCTEYHKQLISPKHADLTNSSSSSSASSSQAAAFLKSFVEEGTKWVHLDIAGTGDISGDATGWGSRLLIEYARHISAKNQ